MTTRLPSKKTGNGRHKQDIRGPDLYPTPAPLTKAILQVEPLPSLIWEPAAGLGHMSKVLQDAGHAVYSSDLVDYGYGFGSVHVADFFSYTSAPKGATCIFTNPPFSLANKFIRHALTLCPKVVIFGRLALLESAGRSDIVDNHLARVYPFVERCMLHRWSQGEDGVYREWAGKKAESAMPMAFFVFLRDHDPSKGWVGRRIWWSKPERNTSLNSSKSPIDPLRVEGKLVLT